MGFSIYYRSTRPVDEERAALIRAAAASLGAGRTWLSCEPVGFFPGQDDGHLMGGSKPNFLPHPDDVASAALQDLPDGDIQDLLEVLSEISRQFDVDWSFSHDHDPGPIGFIRGGVCDDRLVEQLAAIGDLGDILSDLETGEDPEDEGGEPTILPFRPRGG